MTAHNARSPVTHGSSFEVSDCPEGTHDISECGSQPPPLEVVGIFGGRAQVVHGTDCVGLLVSSLGSGRSAVVLTPAQARVLARTLERQAAAALETRG